MSNSYDIYSIYRSQSSHGHSENENPSKVSIRSDRESRSGEEPEEVKQTVLKLNHLQDKGPGPRVPGEFSPQGRQTFGVPESRTFNPLDNSEVVVLDGANKPVDHLNGRQALRLGDQTNDVGVKPGIGSHQIQPIGQNPGAHGGTLIIHRQRNLASAVSQRNCVSRMYTRCVDAIKRRFGCG